MRIIDTPEPKWEYIFTCSRCGTRAAAEATDLQARRYAGDGPHPATWEYTIRCPTCDNALRLNSIKDDIPYLVRSGAEKKYLASDRSR